MDGDAERFEEVGEGEGFAPVDTPELLSFIRHGRFSLFPAAPPRRRCRGDGPRDPLPPGPARGIISRRLKGSTGEAYRCPNGVRRGGGGGGRVQRWPLDEPGSELSSRSTTGTWYLPSSQRP